MITLQFRMATGRVVVNAWKYFLFFVLIFCIISGGNGEACLVLSKSLTREEFKQNLSSRGLKIAHQNIRGLENNIVEVQEFISSHNEIDIFSLSETHLQNESLVDTVIVDGYDFLSKSRSKGLGGGVAIYIKNSIMYTHRKDLENTSLEIIWIEIFVKKSKSIIFGCFYRPSETSNYLLT